MNHSIGLTFSSLQSFKLGPQWFWSFVPMAHLIRLITKEIAIDSTKLPMIEICRSRKKFRASRMTTKTTSCLKQVIPFKKQRVDHQNSKKSSNYFPLTHLTSLARKSHARKVDTYRAAITRRFKGRNRSHRKDTPTDITPAHPKPSSQSISPPLLPIKDQPKNNT